MTIIRNKLYNNLFSWIKLSETISNFQTVAERG